jgi:hypothetical protein
MNRTADERAEVSPSPLNGERAGVRGERVEGPRILQALSRGCLPHLTQPSPLPPGAERERLHQPVFAPSASAFLSSQPN